METNEKKEKFIQLRAEGYSFDKIAKKLFRKQFKEKILTIKKIKF